VVEKSLELDFGVAQDVRVGRAAGLVFAQEIAEYALLVLLEKFTASIGMPMVSATDTASIRSCRDEQYSPVLFVFPVLHEQADYFIALLLKQQGSDRRIYPARHANHNPKFIMAFHVCSLSAGTSPKGAGRDKVAVPSKARDGPKAHRGLREGEQALSNTNDVSHNVCPLSRRDQPKGAGRDKVAVRAKRGMAEGTQRVWGEGNGYARQS